MECRRVDLDRDYDLLAELQAQSWEINFPGELFVEPLFRDAVQHGLRNNDDLWAYIDEGEFVGWIWLQWLMGGRRVHIRHIQVVETHWGNGYGKRMIGDAIHWALERRCTTMSLNVTRSNERAMRLYASLGFEASRAMGPRQEMRLDLRDAKTATGRVA
jgi:GNAT superfamily N-acetyltransferase